MLHLAVALDDRVHLVGAIRIGHRGFQLAHLGGDLADGAGAFHHLGDGGAAFHLADVLAEIADGDAAIDRDLAFVGCLLAGDHAEQGRLAGSVRADEADLLTPVERRGGLDEEELMAVLFGDGVEADH